MENNSDLRNIMIITWVIKQIKKTINQRMVIVEQGNRDD